MALEDLSYEEVGVVWEVLNMVNNVKSMLSEVAYDDSDLLASAIEKLTEEL